MKEKYEDMECEVILFETEDVIEGSDTPYASDLNLFD